jgi:F-type H+-transporting ATPase subunit a
MEHPYLFLVKFFELIGLGHFAQSYPHVVYSWFVVLLLIVLGYFGARTITMVPRQGAEFFRGGAIGHGGVHGGHHGR